MLCQDYRSSLPRLRFHTTLGSGAAAGFPPLAVVRGNESRTALPDLTTRRGLDAVKVPEPGGGVFEPSPFSPSTGDGPVEPALAARNFLLTETALKVAFLTVELVRRCPLSPSFSFDPSVRDISVSEPPLTLGSAELACSSTLVIRLFSTSSATSVPFTVGGFEATLLDLSAWRWSCVSHLMGLGGHVPLKVHCAGTVTQG